VAIWKSSEWRDTHKSVCATLTTDEHARFAAIARRKGVSISRLAIELLRAELAKQERETV